MRTVKIPKRIAKRRAELESEGYQVWPMTLSPLSRTYIGPHLHLCTHLVMHMKLSALPIDPRQVSLQPVAHMMILCRPGPQRAVRAILQDLLQCWRNG